MICSLNNSLSFGSVTERLHGFNALNENNAEKPGANRAKGKNCGVYLNLGFVLLTLGNALLMITIKKSRYV